MRPERHHDHAGDDAQMRRAMLHSLPGQIGNFACATLIAVAFGRWMNVEDFGAYAYAFHTVRLLAMAAGLGFSQSALRLIPRYRKQQRDDEVAGFVLGTVVLTILAGVAVGLIVDHGLGLLADGTSSRDVLAHALWLVPALAMGMLLAGILRAEGSILLSTMAQGGMRDLVAVGIAWYIVSRDGSLGADDGLLALGAAVAIGIVILLVGLVARRSLAFGRPRLAFGEWLGTSWPMAVGTLARLVVTAGPVIIVRLMVGTRDAGLLHGAMVLAMAALIPGRATMTAAAPMLAHHADPDELTWFRRFYRTAVTGGVAGGVLLAAVTIAAGHPLLGLIGPEYQAAYPALVLLSIALALQNAGFVAYGTLFMLGEGRRAAVLVSLLTLFSLALMALGTAAAGIVGAAACFLLGRLVVAAIALRAVHEVTGRAKG